MENVPCQSTTTDMILSINPATDIAVARNASDWRKALPTYCGKHLTLRELQPSDAGSLLLSMASPEVSRYLSPPPADLAGFERFIAWTAAERAAGRSVCFAIVPDGGESAVGVFQVRSLDAEFGACEWGFALASEYWGSGIFSEGAEFVLDFAFMVLGAYRVEARTALRNGRGNSALRKLGAINECVLRKSFLRNGEFLDQSLWTIHAEDWFQSKEMLDSDVIH